MEEGAADLNSVLAGHYLLSAVGNSHPVERAIHEAQRDEQEDRSDQRLGVLILHHHGDLDREQTEERGELDHGI